MKTQRILNSSLFVFIGSLLGSIFGLMGSFGAAMSFSESFVEIYRNKMAQKKHIGKISKNMNQLKGEFGEWKIKKKGNKVYPYLNITDTAMEVSRE